MNTPNENTSGPLSASVCVLSRSPERRENLITAAEIEFIFRFARSLGTPFGYIRICIRVPFGARFTNGDTNARDPDELSKERTDAGRATPRVVYVLCRKTPSRSAEAYRLV